MTQLVPLYPGSDLWLEQGLVKTIDIETGFEDDDLISIALPDFPLDDIDLADSFVLFTSEPDGNFGIGPTDSVSFASSITTLVSGDSEFRFERSLLPTVDLSAISGVKFQIEATDTAEFRCLSIRLLSKDWLYAPIDIDTLDDRIVWPATIDGSVSNAYDTPFTTWPNIFRSADLQGSNDPRPIDSKIVIGFNTGSMTGDNQISLYLRENAVDYMTQFDLEGTPSGELDGLPQPDYGEAENIPRVQIDFDAVEDSVVGSGVDPGAIEGAGLTQGDLNGVPQLTLEAKPDPLTAVWIEVRITWDATDALLEIYDAETAAPYYTFEIELDAELDYFAFIDLEEYSLRASIYEKENAGKGTRIFDSTLIEDRGLFKRRKGRLGWWASFEDGDAFLDSVLTRYLNYAEYRSQAFESITPVAGTALDVAATLDSDLFKGINAGPWGGQFYNNPDRSQESFRIRNTAQEPLQGFQTNSIYLDDAYHTEILFDLYVVQEALDAGSMMLILWDGVRSIALPLPNLLGNVWQTISVDLQPLSEDLIPGNYTIALVQSVIGVPNDWMVDDIRIIRRNIEWSARPYEDDAWDLHHDAWLPYKDAINQHHGGVLFHERANKLQVRGKALRQDATISQVQIKPKYAELGRFNWEDRDPGAAPTANFSSSGPVSSAFEFTSTSTGELISYVWTFGDGAEGTGPTVTHTYDHPGTYPVTLTVSNTQGTQDTHQASVTV